MGVEIPQPFVSKISGPIGPVTVDGIPDRFHIEIEELPKILIGVDPITLNPVEATLTFVTDEDPGAHLRETTPTPEALTVRQHHSLVALPGPGYEPRPLDPRVGYLSQVIYDYASPVTSPLERRWILRHRLQKKAPAAARSEAVAPIVFYVDNGAPPLIRQALKELFNVTVKDVRTMVVRRKAVTRGRYQGSTALRKKAIVVLKDGDVIPVFEG